MKKNSPAFVLVKKLNMSEKRYFKIFSERHTIGTQNKYVALFDELEKADLENDDDLKKKLKVKGIHTDFISPDKNYLYQLILRSLNEFYHSKNLNFKIKESLLSIEILLRKGLYDECMKLIEKNEALAIECENFQLMIELLNWKKNCGGYSLGSSKAHEINLSIDKYLKLLINVKKMADLYYQTNLLREDVEQFNKKVDLEKINDIFKQPELLDQQNVLSLSANIYYHLSYANYYYLFENPQKELYHLQELIDSLNSSKIYAIEHPLDYLTTYNKLIGVKLKLNDNSFMEDVNCLKDFTKKVLLHKDLVAYRIFIHTSSHELEYYLLNNDFQKVKDKCEFIEKEFLKSDIKIEPYHMLYFYYVFTTALVYLGEFNKALKYLNDAMNDFQSIDRPKIYVRLNLLNLIIHFELKNENLVSSCGKKLKSDNSSFFLLNSFEKEIIKTLVRIAGIKHSNSNKESAIFNDLLDRYIEPKSGNGLSLVNDSYLKWVTAKSHRKLVKDYYH